MKVNLGAGSDILAGYVNHDLVDLPGIDVVHNLNQYPWPWSDGSIDDIKMYDVLEHLDDFMKAMEEIYRVLAPGGQCRVSVPYWNSWCAYADPTHKRGFHEITFRFFDPESDYCKERAYYTHARFKIVEEKFVVVPFNPYFGFPGVGEILVSRRLSKRVVGLIGNYFISNLIQGLHLVLEKP
ncbi:MAG: methyltransferase domain-containing protein [Glaciimonas sp.]|nr:methyltransferase domain-containing protein [Glaciimonas sp.]